MSDAIRVLHVDDEPEVAELTAEFLGREDERLEPVPETSASDGLERIAHGNFDCIVSDYDMPGLDGIEFLEIIRDEYPELPFILYTGKGSEKVASGAISAGVTDYLQKGRGTEQYELLANRIQNAVEQYQAGRRLERVRTGRTALFENTPNPIMKVVFEGETPVITEVNTAFAGVFGFEKETVVGRSVTDTVVPESEREEHLSLRDDVAQGIPVETEVRRRTKDGVRDFMLRIIPIEATEFSDGAYAWYTDITERKNRERERERRYEAIFNQTYQFIGLMDPDGTLLEANETALEFGGLDPDDVIGKPFWEAYWWQVDEATQRELRAAIDRASDGEFVRYEVEVQGADDTITIDFSIRPVVDEDGEIEYLIPEGRNMTARRSPK